MTTTEITVVTTRTITVAIDRRCALGGEPLIWGAAEGGDLDARAAAFADARATLGQDGDERAAEKAASLTIITMPWEGDLPDGQNRAAIAAALAVL